MLLVNSFPDSSLSFGPLRKKSKNAYSGTRSESKGKNTELANSGGIYLGEKQPSSSRSLRSVRNAASALGDAAKTSMKRFGGSSSNTDRAMRARTFSNSSSCSTSSNSVLVLPKLSTTFEKSRRMNRPRRNAVHERMSPNLVRALNVDFHFEDADNDDNDDDNDYDLVDGFSPVTSTSSASTAESFSDLTSEATDLGSGRFDDDGFVSYSAQW